MATDILATDPTAPEPTITPMGRLATPPPSVRQLMWQRFRRNRLAIYAGIVLGLMYLVTTLAGFLAPYHLMTTHSKFPGVGPNPIHIIDREGKFHWPPFVYGYESQLDPETYRRIFHTTEEQYPVRFLARGDPYTLFGFIEWDRHLFVVDEPAKVFLMGTDSLGRDFFTRILYGGQVSLTVGLLGVFLSILIGSMVGVMTGLYGGLIDNIVMRLIEVLMAFPQIPLWLALASALPPNLDSIKVYFGITIVLSIINWGGLARQMRAKVLALRDQDYVIAARLANCKDYRIIVKHLFPNTLSHVIVVGTLAIPGMILGETALSFLGLGIRPPMTSWGLLLSDAQATRVLLQQPWLLWPVVPVMLTAICYNLLGDGLRDAADPFADR